MKLKSGTSCEDESRIAWLTLKLISDLGNRSLLRLVRHFGSPVAVVNAGPKEVAAVPGLREQAAAALLKRQLLRAPEEEWESLQREGVRMICLGDPDYPSNLKAIPDPPAVLFVKGALEPRDLVSVAVVGSREASPTGMAFTERLCADLARSAVTVVSGFAVGIDRAAHCGALKAKGRTLAVLGCGLDVDYPRGSAQLGREIAESGALLSEFPFGTPPAPMHFPLRNRIISGLALGVVVVEAAQRSGSLITARFALEQGREVFAVPGPASHFRSAGPHSLLKQGAKLVENVEDILEEIRPLVKPSPEMERRPEAKLKGVCPRPSVTPEEKALLDVLDHTPRHIDDICRRLQWPVSQVATMLLSLEMKGIVQQLPGKHFMDAAAPAET
ncbi:MAG: DNA-processing protein DprA [Syntrophobacteraceae bacterium]|nr:DNA-processing protein DprA [Desulfobacteraceae bacterium]